MSTDIFVSRDSRNITSSRACSADNVEKELSYKIKSYAILRGYSDSYTKNNVKKISSKLANASSDVHTVVDRLALYIKDTQTIMHEMQSDKERATKLIVDLYRFIDNDK